MVKKQGHARTVAGLVERAVKDFDPEADVVPDHSDQNSSDDDSGEDVAGTEHYVSVGKSKIRRNDLESLGPKYQGVRVSRDALEADGGHVANADDDDDEDEEEDGSSDDDSSNYEDALEGFDDPDAVDLERDQQGQEDAEIDSDEAFDESDEERFKDFTFRGSSKPSPKKSRHAKRPTAADFMTSDDEALDRAGGENAEDDEMEDATGDSAEEGSDDEDSLDGSDTGGFIDDEAEESDDDEVDSAEDDGVFDEDSDDDSDEEEDEDEDADGSDVEETKLSKKKTHSLKDSGIAASIKELALGEKSVVQSLSKMVDADVQKGRAVQRQRKGFDALLNIRIRLQKSLVATNSFQYAEQPEDQGAEPYEAAEKAAIQLWSALDSFRSSFDKGKKRKHTDEDDNSTSALWERMHFHENRQNVRRKQVLEKWSRDAKKTSITASSANRFSGSAEKPITAVLEGEMNAPERLIKRTRTPRSCAPYHVARKINEDSSIYDDADFYQLLLKELVDQRSGDGSGAGLQAATIRYAAVKEAKAKRHVDTRASKGRKMRFTPVAKLQNFMAPEDRRSWEQGAIDRFFGTLFGQKLVLTEEASSDEEMDDSMPTADDGLRLFRN
ncbi:TRAUB-domain-containing protein [Xylariaceae sp. FL0594]|nr:TRAUB-domain-containing protein [Xylariaceae sp. FL0594]